MGLIKLPIIPSNELAPRMRLAQKLRAATAKSTDPNDRKGELYEIGVGVRLQQYGWLRGGFQIGRDRLSSGETDQRVYVGNREVDGLLRQGVDNRWLIGQAKFPEQGGSQIREAVEFTLVDQVDSAAHRRSSQLAGLVYAEPNKFEQVLKKVADNVILLLRQQEFSAATLCTRDHLAHALDMNCWKAGLAPSEAKKKLDEYVRTYNNFPVAGFRTQMLDDVRKILGVSVKVMNSRVPADEGSLRTILERELHTLESDTILDQDPVPAAKAASEAT